MPIPAPISPITPPQVPQQPGQPARGSVAANAYNILTNQNNPGGLLGGIVDQIYKRNNASPTPNATAPLPSWASGGGGGVRATSSTQNPPRTSPIQYDPIDGGYAGNAGLGYHYLAQLGISDTDASKILDQINLQAQMLGVTEQDLPALYNQLLPQYAQSALQVAQTTKATTDSDHARASRMAAVQAYLLPQLTGFLNTAQSQANDWSAQTGNKAYGAQQAAANAAYAQQLQALVGMSQVQQQPATPAPTLDDLLKSALAQTPPIPVPAKKG